MPLDVGLVGDSNDADPTNNEPYEPRTGSRVTRRGEYQYYGHSDGPLTNSTDMVGLDSENMNLSRNKPHPEQASKTALLRCVRDGALEHFEVALDQGTVAQFVDEKWLQMSASPYPADKKPKVWANKNYRFFCRRHVYHYIHSRVCEQDEELAAEMCARTCMAWLDDALQAVWPKCLDT